MPDFILANYKKTYNNNKKFFIKSLYYTYFAAVFAPLGLGVMILERDGWNVHQRCVVTNRPGFVPCARAMPCAVACRPFEPRVCSMRKGDALCCRMPPLQGWGSRFSPEGAI
jgi:hypothetical protein